MKSLGTAAVVLTAGLVLALGGCFEEKTHITIHEDASGHVKIESFQAAGGPMMGEKKKPTQEDADKRCYAALARWEGIVAWTDVKPYLNEKGAGYSATGWFEDFSKVRRNNESGGPKGPELPTWTKNADGTFTLEVPPKKKKEGAPEPVKTEPLDERPMPPQLLEMLKTVHVEMVLNLPGNVVSATPEKVWKAKDRTASYAIKGSELVPAFQELEKEKEKVKADVAAGKLTKEEGNKKLKARQAELIPMSSVEEEKTPVKVTCKGGEPADEIKAAKAALAEAKKTYAGSDLEKKIKEGGK